MKNAFGLIVSGSDEQELRELTAIRSIAAVPIAGRYRVIDFFLSNLVNSGIHNVGVITYRNYHSLMDHLAGGVEWDLSRKRDGLFMLPPMAHHNTGSNSNSGTAEAIYGVRNYIERCAQEICILHTNCSMIFKTLYYDAYQHHIDSGADITVMYSDYQQILQTPSRMEVMMKTDDNNNVVDMFRGYTYKKSNKVSMNTFFISKGLLLRLVDDCIMKGGTDFIKDILLPNLSVLDIRGYHYKEPAFKIDTLEGFFKTNLAFLDSDIRYRLLEAYGPVYTKVKDEVPARYSKTSRVENSLVTDGCVIEGSIDNSLLFRGVQVAKGAVLKNCVIMQECQIQSNAILENVVLDKKCTILRGRRLVGTESYPMVVKKGSTI